MNQMWDKTIEGLISCYRRWLPVERKEKTLKLLYFSLRRKYNEPYSQEEIDYCKSKGIDLQGKKQAIIKL